MKNLKKTMFKLKHLNTFYVHYFVFCFFFDVYMHTNKNKHKLTKAGFFLKE